MSRSRVQVPLSAFIYYTFELLLKIFFCVSITLSRITIRLCSKKGFSMKNFIKVFIVFVVFSAFVSSVYAINVAGDRDINVEAVSRAIQNYTQIIQTNPKAEDAYINRAYLNYLLGNIQAAINDYDVLISINSNNEEFYLNRGYLKHISNRREEALRDYDAALKINPNYAFAYNNRGVVLSELGRDSDSLVAYNMAIKINPNYADAYYNRGNLKTKTEKNEEALEDFNTAIRLNPTDSASFNNRGVVKRKLNFNVGALSDFSIAIKLDPEDITALANRGRLKKRYFDSEGAEEDFKSAIALAEESPVIVREVEVQQQIAKNQKPAVVASTPVVYNSAPAELNKVLRQPKVNPAAIQKIAYLKEQPNTSVSMVKASVVKVTPKNDLVSAPVLRQPVNVAPEITTKPVVNPKLAECYYIRALQKYILQNRESALSDFNMAIQYNPKYAEAYYYRAAIKRDLKDEGFVDDYTKAVQLNPSLKAVNDADVLTILKI